MQVNDKQKQIAKLLWDFQSLRENHILKILKYKNKEINNRNIVAFDVVMEYLDRNPKLKKSKHPINVFMKTNDYTYDIIAIKEIEAETLFEKIDEISTADRVIVIIETKEYTKRFINTKRPMYICTYSPLEIVDRIN